jgi:putative transposase
MRKSKYSAHQIVQILKEADLGMPVNEVWRKHGIGSATYYKWKAKYGGLVASDICRLKALESENAKLKRMYAELSPEKAYRLYREAGLAVRRRKRERIGAFERKPLPRPLASQSWSMDFIPMGWRTDAGCAAW